MRPIIAAILLLVALCAPASPQFNGCSAGFCSTTSSCTPSTALNFNFTTGTLPAGITFTRASAGSFFNSSNVLQVNGAATNVARFDYTSSGSTATLLYEPAATNLFVQSNNFNTTWFNNGTGTAASGVFNSPDGTLDGWSFTNVNSGSLNQFSTFSAVSYTVSMWAKNITGSAGALQAAINGNLVSYPALTSTLTRISVSATSTASAGATLALFFFPGTSSNVIGIYGAQWEVTPGGTGAPTSYIPDTTTPATRAADQATFPIPSCVGHLTVTFIDNTTQSIAVTPGASSYTLTNTLNEYNLKTVVGAS